MSTLQLDIDGVDSALERNRSFAAAGGHQGAVVRNVGGRVTPEVINDVASISQIAENVLPDGPLFEVVVIQHPQCGAGAFADDTFRHIYAERIGAEESSLRDHAVLDPAATVARDVQRLRSTRAISPRIRVSGHVYDVVTGLVQTVVPGTTIGAPELPDSASSTLERSDQLRPAAL